MSTVDLSPVGRMVSGISGPLSGLYAATVTCPLGRCFTTTSQFGNLRLRYRLDGDRLAVAIRAQLAVN
jgi:hypothetical protein